VDVDVDGHPGRREGGGAHGDRLPTVRADRERLRRRVEAQRGVRGLQVHLQVGQLDVGLVDDGDLQPAGVGEEVHVPGGDLELVLGEGDLVREVVVQLTEVVRTPPACGGDLHQLWSDPGQPRLAVGAYGGEGDEGLQVAHQPA